MKKMTLTAMFAALMSVSAFIALPSMPPVTLQSLVIFLAVGLLGTKYAVFATVIYLALGAVGLPVFSGFRGGVSVFFEYSGGYLVGFVFAALVSGLLLHVLPKKPLAMFLSFCAGMLVCYAFGAVWYYFVTVSRLGEIGIAAVLLQSVLPYIPFDVLKIALAVFLCRRLNKIFGAYDV